VLQSLIDCEIAITGCMGVGVEFAFTRLKSAIDYDTGHPEDIVPGELVEWTNVHKPSMLAQAIDAKACRLFADRAMRRKLRSRSARRRRRSAF